MRNLLSTLLAGLLFVTMPTQAVPAVSIPNVLVFTGTTGFRHDSIPTAIRVLTTQADRYKVHFEFTEDPDKFNNDTLKTFDAVMFVSATGTGSALLLSVPGVQLLLANGANLTRPLQSSMKQDKQLSRPSSNPAASTSAYTQLLPASKTPRSIGRRLALYSIIIQSSNKL
jgi:hypothetical protein